MAGAVSAGPLVRAGGWSRTGRFARNARAVTHAEGRVTAPRLARAPRTGDASSRIARFLHIRPHSVRSTESALHMSAREQSASPSSAARVLTASHHARAFKHSKSRRFALACHARTRCCSHKLASAAHRIPSSAQSDHHAASMSHISLAHIPALHSQVIRGLHA